jgi:hypothetical protein
MTTERFNELLNGPLAHPMMLMRFNRLALALRHVVEATGEAGERALEEHCHERDAKDRADTETSPYLRD